MFDNEELSRRRMTMGRITKIGGIAATVLAVVLMIAPDAGARIKFRNLEDKKRDYTQRGLQIYAGIGSQSYNIDEESHQYLEDLNDDRGLGFVGVAIGLDRGLALFLEGSGSEHHTAIGDVTFGNAHVGFKFAFATGHRHMWQPYAKASIGATFLMEDGRRRFSHHRDDDDNGYFGPSLGFAAGLDRFIGRRTALFGEIALITGEFQQIVIDGKEHDLAHDIGVTSGKVQFGIRFRL
jgi:hypothetical protein